MNFLAILHGSGVPPALFAEEVEERGHSLDEWSLAWGTPPPLPPDDYDGVFILGGSMHADQDERHPWLREENFFLQRLFDLHIPLFGICLGAQLIAKTAHAPVTPCAEPEVGWHEVELTTAASEDPLFAALPPRFPAFQWHYYGFTVPAGAEELARSEACSQAYRLGDAAWGVQFHPEVTRDVIAGWLAESVHEVPFSPEELLDETDALIDDWNEIGRTLCGAFVEVVEHAAVPA
jgi:GMP synthase-like glutamine amidotransferase